MSNDKKTIVLNSNLKAVVDKDVDILGASIKDALCNYSYELLKGKTSGDVITRKGNQIIHEDLENAFEGFNVFLAHLDDAFTGNDNSTDIDYLRAEPETALYSVSSFKISGVEENKALIISGNKRVTHGVIAVQSPKVKLSGTYLYLDSLTETLNKALNQVEAYMMGKIAPQPEQVSMEFEEMDDSFEKAKVAGE